MATDKQIQANRQNSQRSTGPASDAGKKAVSRNSTTHGLSGKFNFMFLNEEDRKEYDSIFAEMVADHNVTTPSEIQFIIKMAQSLWRSRRAVELQDQYIEIIDLEEGPRAAEARKNLELYIRYQASHDRAYQRYAAELRKFQAEIKKAEIGFVSQKAREAKETRAAAQEIRRENNEKRCQEHHEKVAQFQNARIEHKNLLNRKLAGKLLEAEPAKNSPAPDRLAA